MTDTGRVTRPVRGDRFTHARLLDLDAKPADRVFAKCVVTATRSWGPGETDVTVFWTYVSSWDAGEHRGPVLFRVVQDGSERGRMGHRKECTR